MFDAIASVLGHYAPLTGVLGPLVGGGLGWIGARMNARSNERIAKATREEAARNTATTRQEAAEASEADQLTKRFSVLMDGYEGRIKDLTAEVQSLRQEVTKLRQELALCAGCPHRRGHDGTD